MAIESKPLFHPEVLRQQVRAFDPRNGLDDGIPTLKHWADLIASGRADDFKETALLPDFLSEVFCGLLKYTGPAASAGVFTMSRERHVEVDGKVADAVLGRFERGREQFTAVVEGKGPLDPLDRPFAGRRMSAVDQAYRYAINLPCDWIIVTSIRETRLYYKGAHQQSYERFETVRLGKEPPLLKRFLFLLGAERLVPAHGECHLYELLRASESVGRELTNQFYSQYADIRQRALTQLCRANSAIDPQEILRCTQKLLDRVLFCAFCEDRGLLPPESLKRAFEHHDPYNPKPTWHNFLGFFRAINEGNAGLNIPAYNGGLFAADPRLDDLNVPDDVCAHFKDLGDYDYRPARQVADEEQGTVVRSVIDVDILGHIFEQSITDLERLRQGLQAGAAPPDEEQAKTRRKQEGAFYTPAFITRYIVQQALGGVINERFEHLRREHESGATGTAKKVLADPNVYDLRALKVPQRKALIAFWEAWQDELKGLRILDPACGSGAFLIEAFDQLHAFYEISNAKLEELRGQRTLFDLDRQILQYNLHGVDLNAEAVQICQLSLWIKTAARGKRLTSLDHSIREGNSIISDSGVHPKAFDWEKAFPEVFAKGGFDVVVGNPPYVRQELLGPYKPWLAEHYATYHGMADLYVYFYELGIRVLKPGGLLSFIVTNKWMKAGYGEPLRHFFTEKAWVRSVVDFGHAKQIFEEADVFPSIIVVEKPTEESRPVTARLCTIPREQLRIDDLSVQIEKEGTEMQLSQLGTQAWQLEPKEVSELLRKIRAAGEPLKAFANTKPLRGIVTGFNDAFLIDSQKRNELVAADPSCSEIIYPYIRGQDVDRWQSEWSGLWIIFTRRGINIERYPAVKAHLTQFREKLEPKPSNWSGSAWPGRKAGSYQWFEIQDSIDYWKEFAKPKIVYQEIQFHPSYAVDDRGYLGSNKTFFIVTQDMYLMAVLNSSLMWWHNWRYLPHMKDEALSPVGFLMEELPIAKPTDQIRRSTETAVRRLIEIKTQHQQTTRSLLDWLRVEYSIEKPNQKLLGVIGLDSDALIREVKNVRGKKNPLSSAGLQALRDEHTRSIAPAKQLTAEAVSLEQRISDLVNEAYGLTTAEIELMWKTAPPRMPISKARM